MADILRRRHREEEDRGSGTGGFSDMDSDRAVVNDDVARRIGQDKVGPSLLLYHGDVPVLAE